MTQVHHSFSHKNNSPANHIARFVSRAAQFLCWNRAVFYSVPETGTRKNWYQIDRRTCKFLVPDDWYQFLVRVSPALRNSSYVWIIRNQLAAMLIPWTCPLALVHVSSLQCRIITNYDSCLSYTYTPVLRCNARQSCPCRRPGTCPAETWTAAGPLGQQATTPSRGTATV